MFDERRKSATLLGYRQSQTGYKLLNSDIRTAVIGSGVHFNDDDKKECTNSDDDEDSEAALPVLAEDILVQHQTSDV